MKVGSRGEQNDNAQMQTEQVGTRQNETAMPEGKGQSNEIEY